MQQSLESILPLIYPQEVLSSSYDDYRVGKYTHLFSKDRLLTNRFRERVTWIKDYRPSLDLILQVILSEGRLIETNSIDGASFVFIRQGKTSLSGEEYHLFVSDDIVANGSLQNLERTLKLIFELEFTSIHERAFDTIEEELRPGLECLLQINRDRVSQLKDYLRREVYYDIDENTKRLSFWPFNSTDYGWVILTPYGLYVIGTRGLEREQEELEGILAAFGGKDIDLCLASEWYNFPTYILSELYNL